MLFHLPGPSIFPKGHLCFCLHLGFFVSLDLSEAPEEEPQEEAAAEEEEEEEEPQEEEAQGKVNPPSGLLQNSCMFLSTTT